MTFHAKVTIIFGFAFIKAAVQLLMFMHLTEGRDGRLQSFKVIFAIIITLAIVIGTYWVMQGGPLTTYKNESDYQAHGFVNHKQASILYVSLLFNRNYITIVLRLMGIYFQEGEMMVTPIIIDTDQV